VLLAQLTLQWAVSQRNFCWCISRLALSGIHGYYSALPRYHCRGETAGKTCAELGEKPKRFKLTVGAEDSKFNSTIAADIIYLQKRPVQHVVDNATHFAGAKFLRKVSSSEVRKGFMFCWAHVYLRPLDFLQLDQGSNFTSKEFRGLAEAEGIKIIDFPIESPASMSQFERYHGPLRTAYGNLAKNLQVETKDRLLLMAIHCVHNTVGPEVYVLSCACLGLRRCLLEMLLLLSSSTGLGQLMKR